MNEEEKKYPSLKKELEKKENMIPLRYVCETTAKQIEDDIENELKLSETTQDIPDPYRFAGYNPNVIDFIRRCDTDDQALEIIEYLEKKGDISKSDAKTIRLQLSKNGLRSFGDKKESGFYFKHED